MIELDKIYNEDCLEGMKRIPEGSVDAIICDLPYGTTECAWDSIIPFDYPFILHPKLVKWNDAIPFVGGRPIRQVADDSVHDAVGDALHTFKTIFVVYFI